MTVNGKNIYDMFGKSFLQDIKIGYSRSNKIERIAYDDFAANSPVFRHTEVFHSSGGSSGSSGTGGGGGSTTIQQISPRVGLIFSSIENATYPKVVISNVTSDAAEISFTIVEDTIGSFTNRNYRIIDKSVVPQYNIGTSVNQEGVRVYYSTSPSFLPGTVLLQQLYVQSVGALQDGVQVGYPASYGNRKITGLLPSTKYYYYIRVDYFQIVGGSKQKNYVQTGQDPETGTYPNFTTNAAPVIPPSVVIPTVITNDPTQITINSAIVSGEIQSLGNGNVYERGIIYSTSQNPDINSTKVYDQGSSFGQGTFTLNLSGLLSGNTYYIKAYAKNEAGIGYGTQKTFITLTPPPIPGTVKTNTVSEIGTNKAYSGITIQSFGSTAVTEYGIIWGTNTSYLAYNSPDKNSITVNIANTSAAPKNMGQMLINGLTPNTTYYVRGFIKDSVGVLYGETLSFTTYQVVPVLDSYPAPDDGIIWYQPYKNWEFTTISSLPVLRVSNGGTTPVRKDIVHPINYYFNATFSSNKNYQFRTIVSSFYDTYAGNYVGKSNGASFSIRTAWGESFTYPTPYIHSSVSAQNIGLINLYYYGSLPEKSDTYILSSKIANTPAGQAQIPAQNPITYTANHLFGLSNNTDTALSPPDDQSEYLVDARINELSWKIQGFSFYTLGSTEGLISSSFYAGKGWHYNRTEKKFTWFDRYSTSTAISNIKPSYGSNITITLNENDKNNPVGGPYGQKISHKAYRKNNYVAKYIGYQNFNITFTYKCSRADKGIRIYLSQTLPTDSPVDSDSLIIPEYSTMIASLTQSRTETNGVVSYGVNQECSFVGLEGNQYFYIVGDTIEATTSTYFICEISDMRVSGGYHIGNNKRYYISPTSSTFATKSIMVSGTYSALIGSGNTVNAKDSISIITIGGKIGNGNFKSGIWENGVWNNGWREDKEIREFYKIEKFISYDRDIKWQIYISGPESSLNAIDESGSYVFSVGDRVSISNIVAIDLNESRTLLKKFFRIIEKTSTYLVVEFESNFPLRRIEIDSPEHRINITKNVWLSGTFFNGYFKGIWNYGLFAGYPYLTKMENSHWIDGIFSGGHFYAEKYNIAFSKSVLSSYSNSKRLGLTFSKPHKLATGDIINITGSKNLGETVIVSTPDEYSFITGISWKKEYSDITGTVYSLISSGLIQNFEFYAKNVSKNTSVQSLNSKNVFVYNSWIDVNYSDKSAVNIGKPQSLLDEISGKGYSENNLYGYPTTDVLSSKSSFRDSFSNKVRDYKLGTKYKIYGDYIGDSSKFEEYFDSTDTSAGLDKFTKQGWQFAKDSTGLATFSRTPEPVDTSSTTIGKELRVFAKGKGGVLNLTPAYDINNRINEEVDKMRYTMVEFDMLTYSVAGESYIDNTNGLSIQPTIHFGNLNYTTRTENGTKTKLASTYLPIYENINHLKTGDVKKQEFFFNKRNLLMSFRGAGTLGAESAEYFIDNLKLYEVDMVPFFEYFKNDNINKGIQNPYQVIAPIIDYNEDEETSDPQILSDYIDAGDISAENGINWVEDIILKRYQVVSSEYDTDIEDIVSEVDPTAGINPPTATTDKFTLIRARSVTVNGTSLSAETKGIYWGTDPNPKNNGQFSPEDASGNLIEIALTGLSPLTTYYAIAYAINIKGTAYGTTLSFKTTAEPAISMVAPTGTTNNATNVSGSITNANGETITDCGFEYSTTNDFSTVNTVSVTPTPLATTVQSSISKQITGLSPSTSYYIRPFLIYGTGYKVTGTSKTTITGNLTAPTLSATTNTANTTTVDGTSAKNTTTVAGTITSDGGATITERGFVYSMSQNPTISDTKFTSPSTNLSYTYTITILTIGKRYYFRSYAINSVGISYGAQVSVDILTIPPILTTGSLGTPTAAGISVNTSNITNDGGTPVIARGVVYGTAENPTIYGSVTSDGNGTGTFDSKITGLAIKTTYYVRAYATTSAGTSYGSQKSFITTGTVPTVQTAGLFEPHITLEGDTGAYYQGGVSAKAIFYNINYVKGGGKIIDDGGDPILEVGLVWTLREISNPVNTLISGIAMADIGNSINFSDNQQFTNVTVKYDRVDFYEIYTGTTPGNGTPISFTGASRNQRLISPTRNTGFEWKGTITNIKSSTEYAYAAYARNKYGIAYGEQITISNSLTTTLDDLNPPNNE